jgi:hypothetical protein
MPKTKKVRMTLAHREGALQLLKNRGNRGATQSDFVSSVSLDELVGWLREEGHTIALSHGLYIYLGYTDPEPDQAKAEDADKDMLGDDAGMVQDAGDK